MWLVITLGKMPWFCQNWPQKAVTPVQAMADPCWALPVPHPSSPCLVVWMLLPDAQRAPKHPLIEGSVPVLLCSEDPAM